MSRVIVLGLLAFCACELNESAEPDELATESQADVAGFRYRDTDGNNPRVGGCMAQYWDTSFSCTTRISAGVSDMDYCLDENTLHEAYTGVFFDSAQCPALSCCSAARSQTYDCDEFCRQDGFGGGTCETSAATMCSVVDWSTGRTVMEPAGYCECRRAGRKDLDGGNEPAIASCSVLFFDDDCSMDVDARYVDRCLDDDRLLEFAGRLSCDDMQATQYVEQSCQAFCGGRGGRCQSKAINCYGQTETAGYCQCDEVAPAPAPAPAPTPTPAPAPAPDPDPDAGPMPDAEPDAGPMPDAGSAPS